MKQPVLKALANPPHLFNVPYTLAVINFVGQFVVFIALYTISMVFLGNDFTNTYLNPLYFLISVIGVHMILAGFSKHDSQLGQILIAKIKMLKNKIPRRLPA
ncbi:MAG: VirB3 family type IV secretion system protein [Alphaproteobacteria bacterium]|nr:VirB3 family type IV secretion system protein [Alphaproteobacteria bacterium]